MIKAIEFKRENPSYIIHVDFGKIGIKKLAQITKNYKLKDLIGEQIVVNYLKNKLQIFKAVSFLGN